MVIPTVMYIVLLSTMYMAILSRFHISLDLVILIGNPHDSDCLCRKIFHLPYYYILLEKYRALKN